MARLLVFDRDNTHDDPVRDREGCYKMGDVVFVGEDGHEFSALELQAPFRIVDLPGPASAYEHLRAGEPRTLRDDFPRAMMPMRRLHKAMRGAMSGSSRRRRGWRVAADDQVQRKPTTV